MTKQITKRDADFYEKKAKEIRAKEEKKKQIAHHKAELAKLRKK